MKKRYVLLVFGAALAAFIGCNSPSDMIAKKIVLNTVKERLGPADSYKIEVDGSTGEYLKGKVRRIHIVGKGVRTNAGLKVAEVDAVMTDVKANTKKKNLESVGSTVFTAVVDDYALTDYVNRERDEVKDFNAVFEKGKIKASAKLKTKIASVRTSFESELVLRNKETVDIDLDKLKIFGVSTPGVVRNFVEKRLNPIFSSDDMAPGTVIDSIRVDNGTLRVSGTLDLVSLSAMTR